VGLEAKMAENLVKLWVTLTFWQVSLMEMYYSNRLSECKLGISAVAHSRLLTEEHWQIVLQRYNNLLITMSLILGEL